MIFTETKLKGAYLVELAKLEDERGFFARAWCQHEFAAQGLTSSLVQCNVSFNKKRGTVRGMHYQLPPYAETKLVRCTRGAIYDAIIDLRPGSTTFLQWLGIELTAENYRMLYVPVGFAHGFQTLVDNSEVFYQMSEFYAPDAGRGVRWNDPLFNLRWPRPVSVISDRDQHYAEGRHEQFHLFSGNDLA